MDSDIVNVTLAVLAIALSLNLKLSLAVLRATRSERTIPAAPVVGQPMRALTARTLAPNAPVQLMDKQATVLLFLDSRCTKCSATLPDLEHMFPTALQAGLSMWLVSQERPWRLRRFLRAPALLGRVARLDIDAYRSLNPLMSAPSYLFVNHDGVLEASGMIGDENWLGLRSQLGLHDNRHAA